VGGGRRGAGGKETDCIRGVRFREGKERGKAMWRRAQGRGETVERRGGGARSLVRLRGRGVCGGRVSHRCAGPWWRWRRGGLVPMVGA